MLLASGLSLVLTAGIGVAIAPGASADTVSCSGDECDGGRWLAARGEDNSVSYWGMSQGHNCTNYVAWRLIGDGVRQPRTGPGDASGWAANAIVDGYEVDHTPIVGAVAQWDAFAGGNGADGHVAYIEAVNADGSVVVSEDYWHGGDQQGPLTYRTVSASEISHIIHYSVHPDWMRLVGDTGTGWGQTPTGLDPFATALSAVTVDGKTPLVFYSESGQLVQASPIASGWQAVSTGLKSVPTSMSAVVLANHLPYVMSIERGVLVMSVSTPSGWQFMSTGIQVSGSIAAMDIGGLWPTVYVSQNGGLFRVWCDMSGWHLESTGIEIWGPISAAMSPTGWPEIYSIESGTLFETWLDQSGWHKELTGVTASGTITAASSPTGVQVMIGDKSGVSRVTHSATSTNATIWTTEPTGLPSGVLMSAVDLGSSAPSLVQVGLAVPVATPTQGAAQ